MVSINIREFAGYDAASMEAFLLLQQEQKYQVVIPKETWSPEYPRELIVQEYYCAMYIGEKLSELSVNFGYNVPSPHKTGQFIFDIEVPMNNLQVFAKFLEHVIGGYVQPMPGEAWEAFMKEAWTFFIKTDGDGDTYPVCGGLLVICEQFYDYPENQ